MNHNDSKAAATKQEDRRRGGGGVPSAVTIGVGIIGLVAAVLAIWQVVDSWFATTSAH